MEKNLTYRYDFSGTEITIERHYWRTAYPRNGNTHNPTIYYRWQPEAFGVTHGLFLSRAEAYEYIRQIIEATPEYKTRVKSPTGHWSTKAVRPYQLVAAEMAANLVKA